MKLKNFGLLMLALGVVVFVAPQKTQAAAVINRNISNSDTHTCITVPCGFLVDTSFTKGFTSGSYTEVHKDIDPCVISTRFDSVWKITSVSNSCGGTSPAVGSAFSGASPVVTDWSMRGTVSYVPYFDRLVTETMKRRSNATLTYTATENKEYYHDIVVQGSAASFAYISNTYGLRSSADEDQYYQIPCSKITINGNIGCTQTIRMADGQSVDVTPYVNPDPGIYEFKINVLSDTPTSKLVSGTVSN